MRIWDTASSKVRDILQDNLAHLVGRKALSGFIANGISTGICFLISVLLAKAMDIEHYGIYVLVIAWLNILHLIGRMGMVNALVRFGAEYCSQYRWSEFRGIIKTAHFITLSLSIFVSGTLVLTIWLFSDLFSVNVRIAFYVGSLILPIWSITTIRQAAMRAQKIIFHSLAPEGLVRPAAFGLLLIFFWSLSGFQSSLSSSFVVILALAAGLIALLASSILLKHSNRELICNDITVIATRQWIQYGIPMMIASGLIMLMKYIDVFMIGTFIGPAAAGLYSVASLISEFTIYGWTAFDIIAAPLISELFSANRQSELRKVIHYMTIGSIIFALISGCVLFLAGKYLLLIFGNKFVEALPCLQILILGQVIRVTVGHAGSLMIMTGHQNKAIVILGFCVLINLLFNVILIPQLGIIGAAFATVISVITWQLLLLIGCKKYLHIDSSIIGVLKMFHTN